MEHDRNSLHAHILMVQLIDCQYCLPFKLARRDNFFFLFFLFFFIAAYCHENEKNDFVDKKKTKKVDTFTCVVDKRTKKGHFFLFFCGQKGHVQIYG
jgi:hypothetical protein